MSAVLYGLPMTGWDGGRDAPEPNSDIRHLVYHGQEAIHIKRLGDVRCEAGRQALRNITFINTPADGNGWSYVALRSGLRA
jgi:hypothetical protein